MNYIGSGLCNIADLLYKVQNEARFLEWGEVLLTLLPLCSSSPLKVNKSKKEKKSNIACTCEDIDVRCMIIDLILVGENLPFYLLFCP